MSGRHTTNTIEPLTLEQRREFMKLPLEERRRRMAEQAARMEEYYDSPEARAERELWQGGDIVEY